MHTAQHTITSRRCDEPMKRRKEQCDILTADGYRYKWRCKGDCANCFCCLVKLDDGTEQHVNLMTERNITR